MKKESIQMHIERRLNKTDKKNECKILQPIPDNSSKIELSKIELAGIIELKSSK
jgi:hypothetical protein